MRRYLLLFILFLFDFNIGQFLADLIYSCLPRPGGEHRREELYQRNPMVWYHRGLCYESYCQHQSWPSWLDDEQALVKCYLGIYHGSKDQFGYRADKT